MVGFDAISSGFGGETGDTLVVNVSHKSVWRLKPLPLSQVNPSLSAAPARIGPPPSLQTSCLDTVSTYFHEYTPDALVGLPAAHVQRILAKVRSDRRHPDTAERWRPDEATIWAYSVLADPEGTERDMTLGLHPATALRQIAPNPALDPPDHPFVQLPKLYAALQPETSFQLMTTLRFDGARDHVRDDNIMTLRYATNLTVLSMRDCVKVTDTAIRLLSSGLVLPGERGADGVGMWRLRAWFMQGCGGISDKSMRSLARWPGLVAIDIRNTSCTSAALQVYNKASQDLFACQLADMQPVSASLRQLFARKTSSASILAGLNATLLGPSPTGSRQYRALHIIPYYDTLSAEDLPDPPALQNSAASYNSASAYRTGGIGQIYGTDVCMVRDEGSDFRSRVQTALKMQAMDEGLVPEERMSHMEEKERDRWKKRTKAEEKREERAHKKLMKGYKEDVKKAAAVKPKKDKVEEMEVVVGEAEMMLVRVGQSGWDRLTWTIGANARGTVPVPVLSTQTQRAVKKGNLVGDILGLIQPGPSRTRASSPLPLRSDIKPILDPLPQSSQISIPATPTNPIAFARKAAAARDSAPSPVSTQMPAPSSSPDMSNSFDGSQGKKRRFGGVDASQGEVKRRGMKMFTRP